MNVFEYDDNYYKSEINYNQIQNQNYELLLRQLEVCLNFYKPHFELEYKYKGVSHDNEDFEYQDKRHFFSLIIFDKQQNLKKKLVAFDNNCRNEKLIKYYINLLKYFPRKDLIYLLYDFYYLDDKKTFYIFELECPKIANFSNFMDYFDVVEDTVQKIKTAFCDQLIEFDKTQLVKQFRSKDKNKFDLFDQDYLLKIFSNKKIVYYKNKRIKEQLYIKELNQIPLSFYFAQFEDFHKYQQKKQSNQDESQDSIEIEENENMQQEENVDNQEQSEELNNDSIYSSLFDGDSQFNQNGDIDNLIENEEDKNSQENIPCDSYTNQNTVQIDDHPSSIKSLQSQEQTQNIQQEEQDFNQFDKQESLQKQNLKTEFNSQETNFQNDTIQEYQTNKIGLENKQDNKKVIQALNDQISQSKQEDQNSEQMEDNSNSQEQQQQEQEQEEEEEIDQKNSINQDQNSSFFSYWNTDQDLVNQLLDFNQNILIKIKKENFITKIKEFYSDILNYHQEEIFFLIQQHPKYDNFEVLSYNSEQFKLKCKKDNDFRILLIKKFSCFQKIQEEEKLINQQSRIINNLIVTETILQEKHSYLLVEFKYFQPSKSYRSIELTKDQLLVNSLEIKFDDYINWLIDVQQENLDLYNSLFKQQQQQWTLPYELQEKFNKHLVTFQSYLKLENNQQIEEIKNENELELEIPSQNQLQDNDVDDEQEDEVQLSLLSELKNMLTICFEHNLKKKTNFKIEIIKSNTIDIKSYKTQYDYDYYNIASEFMKESSQLLKIEIKKYNSQATFNFAYVQEKILILEILNDCELCYQELRKEDFSFLNIQRLVKKMMCNTKAGQNYNQRSKLNFRMLQNFDNLQQLILDLSGQDVVVIFNAIY
ncbi:hypothetical protein ABPG72_011510 [Tetrahymena utriculariae]